MSDDWQSLCTGDLSIEEERVCIQFANGRHQWVNVETRVDGFLLTSFVVRGAVAKGGKFQVKISYAGRPNWMIKELQVGNQHLAAMFNETRRAGGRVDYTLEVTLKPTAPVGRLRDLIILVTDDEANPFVPLLVEANVEPDIVVTPGIVSLRSLAPGQQVRAQVVIRGKAPFEVEKIESVNGVPGFQARRPQLAKPVHVVPFSLTAQSTAGRFEEEFKVWIVGRPEPVTFKATGEVVGANPRLGSNR